MQYQVLARKWRPQNFQELVGQEHVSRTLQNALRTGRVAHAFIFSGPRGSGKTTTARVLAKALNCHRNTPGDPCGECVACREIAAGNCMDVLEMDAASNRGIDEIRDLIENVRYNPARDRHKIFIIDEVHMLTEPAFNALLKTLEEPPAHVVFIMATTEYHKIPATILSRCQQYTFKLIPLPLVLERLREIATAEGVEISLPALEAVAFSSGGSLRDAMSAFDQVLAFSGDTVRDEDVTMLLGLVEPRVLAETVRAIAHHDTDTIFRTVGELVDSGQDLQNFCRRLLGQLRNLTVLKAGVREPAQLGIPESLLPDLRAQADLFSNEDLLRLFDSLLETEAELKQATETRFALEMGLVKLARMARLRPLEELIAEFRALVEESGGSPPEPPSGGGSGRVRTRAGSDSAPSRPAEMPRPGPPSRGRNAGESPPAAPEPIPAPEAVGPPPEVYLGPPPAAPPDGEDLVREIQRRISRQSLEPILASVPSARVLGDTVLLDVAALNEFYRRQLRENLAVIGAAASEVFGRPVKAGLQEASAAPAGTAATARKGMAETPARTGATFSARTASSHPAPKASSADPSVSVLERVKREPVVQSFLDVFPGPVKAEGLD